MASWRWYLPTISRFNSSVTNPQSLHIYALLEALLGWAVFGLIPSGHHRCGTVTDSHRFPGLLAMLIMPSHPKIGQWHFPTLLFFIAFLSIQVNRVLAAKLFHFLGNLRMKLVIIAAYSLV